MLSSEASAETALVIPGSKSMGAQSKTGPSRWGGTLYISSLSTKPSAHSRCLINSFSSDQPSNVLLKKIQHKLCNMSALCKNKNKNMALFHEKYSPQRERKLYLLLHIMSQTPLTLPSTLWGRCYHPHRTDEKTE